MMRIASFNCLLQAHKSQVLDLSLGAVNAWILKHHVSVEEVVIELGDRIPGQNLSQSLLQMYQYCAQGTGERWRPVYGGMNSKNVLGVRI